MNAILMIFLLVTGGSLGFLFALILSRPKVLSLLEQTSRQDAELQTLRNGIERQAAELSTARQDEARLSATLESERAATVEKLQLLSQARTELENSFKALASAALESNNSSFLTLAKSILDKQHSEAKGELAKREQAVEQMVKPLADSLKNVDEQVRQLEKSRAAAYGTLTQQVASLLETQKSLQAETGNLVKAMREPQARGRWGELQLRRVVELAGMVENCDFDEQVTAVSDERRYRPDVVVRLPGGKQIVIDSKAPLSSYLNAMEANDDATRKACLVQHARLVKKHIDSLADKSYYSQFQPSPEFVVLFLPGEVFFRAALDCDPELLEYAVSRGVIVASPTTLIALLKAVAFGWNQKNLAESASRISVAGKELYSRLCTMAGHVDALGKKLDGAVKAYNEMLSSIERRVFPSARRIAEMDRALSAESLPEIEQVEKTVRHIEAPDWHEELRPGGGLFEAATESVSSDAADINPEEGGGRSRISRPIPQ